MGCYEIERYEKACALLPQHLRIRTMEVDAALKEKTVQLHLRCGQPLFLGGDDGETMVENTRVALEDLEQVMDLATEYSRYTAAESMKKGYVTAAGGFRIGICGSAAVERGNIHTLSDLSSLTIRIPREYRGAAGELIAELCPGNSLFNTLIISGPCGGKTTLLRDLVRVASDSKGMRVALVDERGEIAALHRGVPQMDVGKHTDVMDGCPKALAIPNLLRAMSPKVIAVDEITGKEDVTAMERAANSGVALLATVHGESVQALRKKSLFANLFYRGFFSHAVLIEKVGEERKYRVEKI